MPLGTPLNRKGSAGPSGSKNLTVSLPTGAPTGCIAILDIDANSATDGSTDYDVTLSGWTQITDELSTNSGKKRLWQFWRLLVAGDASWTVVGSGTACARCWSLTVYPGSGTVGAQAAISPDSSETAMVGQGVTTTEDGAAIHIAWTHYDASDTPPGSMTHLAGFQKSGDLGSGGIMPPVSLRVRYEVIPTAGATGTRTLTASSSGNYCSGTIEVQPAVTAQTVTISGGIQIFVGAGVPKVVHEVEDTPAEAAIKQEGARLLAICKMDPVDSGGNVRSVRASTGDYRTGSGEGDPDARYRSILAESFEISRSVFEGRKIGGRARVTAGQIPLLSSIDRSTRRTALSALFAYDWNDKPLEYAIAGYDRWRNRILWDDRRVIFKGRTSSIRGTRGQAIPQVSDLGKKLQKPAQDLLFDGSGGKLGNASVKGRRMPKVYGSPQHCKPIQVSSQDQLFVFHGDSQGYNCQGGTWYVNGQLLLEEDYELDLTGGINSILVTTDITGYELGGAITGPAISQSTNAAMIRYLVQYSGPLTADEIDLVRLAIFAAEFPGDSGWYIDGSSKETFEDLLNIFTGPGGYALQNENDQLEVGLWRDPHLESPDWEPTESEIESVERLSAAPPLQRMRLGYSPNFLQLSLDQVAEAARGTEFGEYVLEPHLIIDQAAEDPDPNTDDPEVWRTALTELVAATLEAERIWAYQNRPWQLYRVRAGRKSLLWELGQVVRLTWPEYDETWFGLNTRVAEISYDLKGTTTLLWCPDPIYVLGLEGESRPLALEDGGLLELG